MLALLKRNFLLYFRNRSGVFFSLLGALISFILYIIFLQKNLTDAWAQLPNSGPLLNNWLMSGTLAVTGITTSLAALTQLVKDREHQVVIGSRKVAVSIFVSNECNHHFFCHAGPYVCADVWLF